MGFLGGSGQGVSSSSNILDFNPVFNIGDGNSSAQEKSLSSEQATSPRLDDSLGISASVGVGFGGEGSGGTATTSRQQSEATQPMGTAPATSGILSGISPTYILISGGAIALLIFISKKKKKS